MSEHISRSEYRYQEHYDSARYGSDAAAWRYAEGRVCEMVDEVTDFLCGTSIVPREPSDYFGVISNAELIGVAMNPQSSGEQCKAAMMEIRKRYLKDREVLVREYATGEVL